MDGKNNIFVLEDNKDRIQIFQRILPVFYNDVAIINYCDNVKTAKKQYNNNLYNIIFLDHDLGNKINVDSREENTGYQFAKFLAGQYGIHNKEIIIHSMNFIGAQNILKVLPYAKMVAFSQLVDAMYEYHNSK